MDTESHEISMQRYGKGIVCSSTEVERYVVNKISPIDRDDA